MSEQLELAMPVAELLSRHFPMELTLDDGRLFVVKAVHPRDTGLQEEIVRIDEDIFAAQDTYPITPAYLRDVIFETGLALYIPDEFGHVAAESQLIVRRNQTPESVWLEHMLHEGSALNGGYGVRADKRKQGLGTALLIAMERAAALLGVRTIYTPVDPRNGRSIVALAKRGNVIIGIDAEAEGHEARFVMRQELDPDSPRAAIGRFQRQAAAQGHILTEEIIIPLIGEGYSDVLRRLQRHFVMGANVIDVGLDAERNGTVITMAL